jgi:hypothetical protein
MKMGKYILLIAMFLFIGKILDNSYSYMTTQYESGQCMKLNNGKYSTMIVDYDKRMNRYKTLIYKNYKKAKIVYFVSSTSKYDLYHNYSPTTCPKKLAIYYSEFKELVELKLVNKFNKAVLNNKLTVLLCSHKNENCELFFNEGEPMQ